MNRIVFDRYKRISFIFRYFLPAYARNKFTTFQILMEVVITDKGILTKTGITDWIITDHSVYEVIRIINGIPLFLEDHFNRLQKSMKIQGISFRMAYQEFRQNIAQLVSLNRKPEGNIKFEYSITENEPRWVFTFIPYSYPTPEDYRNGVKTGFLYAERENPNAKVVQNTIRASANQLIAAQKLYEVMFVDRAGLITEGSRSNVFFVKGEVFYTASTSLVLEGITRQKVLVCLAELNFPIIEEAIRADEISRVDAVFLTGTSPKVLPVQSIGNQIFSTQATPVKLLMERYNNLIDQYLQNEKT